MNDEIQRARVLDRFAGKVVELRQEAGLTQADVGRLAGIDRTAVSLLEGRLRLPRLDTILRIAGAFETEPWELMEGLEWTLDPALWARISRLPEPGGQRWPRGRGPQAGGIPEGDE
jgi:transcriptional regulator with XRE-family HTH domain